MNKEQIDGKFEQYKGEFKKAWGKLTDNDVMLYNGKQDAFFGVLKEKHGILREAAEQRIKEFQDAIKPTKAA